jgi:putative endopeptidase
MVRQIFVLGLVMGLLACQGDAGRSSAADTLVSGFDASELDTSISPGDDFFAYANGKALAAIEIPADKSRYGAMDVLRDNSDAQVREIIEESAEGEFLQGSDQQRVGDLYSSFLDWETRDARGLTPITPFLNQIDALQDHNDVFAYFGVAARYGFNSPVEIWQYADAKDPSIYAFYLSQGGIGLPDREYYFKDDAKSELIREQYRAYIADLHQIAGMAIDADGVRKIYDLEESIAKQHMLKERMRRFADNYRRIEASELPDLVTGVEWSGYLASFGLAQPGYLVSISSDYFNALGGLIVETSVEDWQRYLRWQLINAEASLLTKAMDQSRFNFYRKTLSGVEQQLPDWQRAVGVVGRTLGELVGKVYVERHFPPEAKARMEALVANLIDAYRDSVTQLDWMSEATKIEALDKLSKFKPMIGYPDEFRDYAGVIIEADDYYGNRLSLVEAERDRDIARHGAQVDRTEWSMTPQTVNAYYSPVLNVIVFPAAILQPPFFNLDAEDAVNYGGIGAVIGHEIGHGLDDSGSKFDGDGAIRNWWTDEDAAQFEVRTNSLIAQYENFCPFDDLCTNGEFTLGENIGDLGGITIALRAYQASLNGKEAPVLDGMTGVQRVFLGFAQIWRAKMRDEAMRQLIATNPHSPSQYRTNGPVRNLPEWYDAFNVSSGDALYLPPEERVKIW